LGSVHAKGDSMKTKRTKATRQTQDKKLAAHHTPKDKLKALLLPPAPPQSNETAIVRAWHTLAAQYAAPALRSPKVIGFVHDGVKVSLDPDFDERLSEESETLAHEAVDAMLSWKPEFFESIAKEMRRISADDGNPPDPQRVLLLKAGLSGVANLGAIARDLKRAGDKRDIEGIRRTLRRIARRINIKTVSPGRPRSK
jgi:hypothetical protein